MAGMRLENINKSFDKNHVLKGVSLEVGSGEFISILGPSGCGKTTLLRVIAGLEQQDSGSVFLEGECCDGIPARKRGAVIVFQDLGLFPHMTVRQNIDFGLAAKKISKAERNKKISYMLDVMQISDKGEAYPVELSGGQKQRVALARACVLEPRLLLLDEPFSALDQALKDDMREFVSKLQKNLGITTVLVTHDKEEAFMLSRRVAVIIDGNLLQYGSPESIYAKPKTMEVSDFIGEANYIEEEISDGRLNCLFGAFDALGLAGPSFGGRARLMLRYDQLILSRTKGIPCTILEKKYKGSVTTYTVKVSEQTDGLVPSLTLKVNSAYGGFESGGQAFVRVADGAGWVL